ncbi:MAG: hypothetical protein AAF581_23935, partial [Planctomycetota bacterium]
MPKKNSRKRSISLLLITLFCAFGAMTWANECTVAPFGTGDFWVSSYGDDTVLRFDEVGNYLGSFSSPQLDGPRSITVMPSGEVYVASQLNDQILVFDGSGTFLRSFVDVELDGPTGAAIAPNGDYIVCSFSNNKVLRFNASETRIATYSAILYRSACNPTQHVTSLLLPPILL